MKRVRLLIADDDPVVRSMLSMGLERQFEIVATAADAEEAVKAARSLSPDAAVVDVDMPRGGGERAVRGIAEVSPCTAIVVLSADEQDALVRSLMLSGAMAYCRKGITATELAALIWRSVQATRDRDAAGAGTGSER